jgi:hypothetical protein
MDKNGFFQGLCQLNNCPPTTPQGWFFWYCSGTSDKDMAINIEIKGNLARLLATENLLVEHRNVQTAMFDVDRRILTLPMWEKASATVYDMLVGHEVGHALFTPFDEWNKKEKYSKIPPDYVNVVEDARIERLMKKKFAGLSRDFYNAYQELHADDFFSVKEDDVNEMHLIDRINLYFKIGVYLCIDFNDDENQFVNDITKAETFEQVLDIALAIYEYSKKQQESATVVPQKTNEVASTPNPQGGEDDGESLDEDEDGETNESPQESRSEDENVDVSKTQRAFESNSQELIKHHYGSDIDYIGVPELNLENVVVPFDSVFSYLREHFTYDFDCDKIKIAINESTSDYNKFKKSSAKEVNYLVKEFEMKKSADAYARTSTCRTGVLDTRQLHTYKYNEDLFRKVSVIADGKNHGLVFLLDWSGSMQYTLHDSIKQLFSLIWFCKKVNIPFDVYAFSNDAWAINHSGYDIAISEPDQYPMVKKWIQNDIAIEGYFRMVNIFTSKSKNKDLDEMMKYIWLCSTAFSGGVIPYPSKFALSGTPLNEAILALLPIMKKFISDNKLQKCHTVIFTDGEGQGISRNDLVTRGNNNPYTVKCRKRYVVSNSMLRNRRTGNTYKLGETSGDNTLAIIKAVKDELPQSSFIAFRVIGKGDLRNFHNWYGKEQYRFFEDMKTSIKKDGHIQLKSSAFDIFYGIPLNNISVDSEFDVSEDASKREVATAFRKMFKNKGVNKKVLQTFIEQVA